MRKITFFLGAGASKAFGLPLTTEIFPKVWKNLNRRRSKKHRRLVRLLTALYPGINNQGSNGQLPGINDVLSIIDHFIINGQVPLKKFTLNEMREYRQDLEMAVIAAIEDESFYSYEETDEDKLYDRFIKTLLKLKGKFKVDIISTNYDITIEYGLYHLGKLSYYNFIKTTDFGLKWRDPENGGLYTIPENPQSGIYKLHGSTNWLACELCNQVYINIEGSIFDRFNEKVWEGNTCHCGHAKLTPVIVSPSLVRNVLDTNLKYVWNSALESLRTSDEWFIIGYSLPAEDLNIRSILTRAINARMTKPKINVVQYGMNAKVRYENLFGEVKYYQNGLNEHIVSMLEKKLNRSKPKI